MSPYKCKRGQRTWPAASAGGRGAAATQPSCPGDAGAGPGAESAARWCQGWGVPALPLFGGIISSARRGKSNNPEPVPWLEHGSEALGLGIPGDR